MKHLAPFLWFELRRARRDWALWLPLAVVFCLGLYEGIVGGNEPAASLFSTFFAVYIAAWSLSHDRISGGAEILLNSGLSLQELMWVRFAVSVVLVGTLQTALLLPPVIAGTLRPVSIPLWLARVVFGAALGASAGWFVPAGSLLILPLTALVAFVLWVFEGLGMRLLGQPLDGPIAYPITLLFSSFLPYPLEATASSAQLPLRIPPAWNYVPLLWAALLLYFQHRRLQRYSLIPSQEG